MENQFKKLLEKSKAQKEQKDPLFKTFEGALFSPSSWFFHFQSEPPETTSLSTPPEVIKASAPLISAEPEAWTESDYQSLVLFVGDSYRGEGEDLLAKMISAMKLKGTEVSRFLLDTELEDINDLAANLLTPNAATIRLWNEIAEKKPKIVVSLGATVTNVLLGRREKLSAIHGQAFPQKVKNFSFQLVPVFHPDFLIINPNMKRTAWNDLQKVMEHIGKI